MTVYVSNKHISVYEVGAGPALLIAECPGPLELERVHFSFTGNPPNEDAYVLMRDHEGRITAFTGFNPSREKYTEVTKVFERWGDW